MTALLTLVVAADGAVDASPLVESLVDGGDQGWELLVPAASTGVPTDDPRVRRVDAAGGASHLAAAIAASRGELLVLVDPDVALDAAVLSAVRDAAATSPEPELIYLDELSADGTVVRKPDWSPERLRWDNYVGRPVTLRTEPVRTAYPAASGSFAAAEYDLLLRVIERRGSVVHLTAPPARRGSARQVVLDAEARSVLEAHLVRSGIDADVMAGDSGHSIVRRLDPSVRVSIIVPTRGQAGAIDGRERVFVVEAVRSALARTRHPSVEVVVVHDLVTPDEVLAELAHIAGPALVTVPYEHPFNFSEKCNIGSLHASGDVLVLLNDDTEVLADGWLEALVAPLGEPDVGMTGAKLRFPDRSIQFAGHLYSTPPPRKRQWRHLYHRFLPPAGNEPRELLVNRECSGVTAACSALRRDAWELVGGLNEGLPANYNDVDLSYKVRAAGLRIVWVAGSELFHFESKTRDKPAGRPEEIAAVERRWGRPVVDPYWPWPDP